MPKNLVTLPLANSYSGEKTQNIKIMLREISLGNSKCNYKSDILDRLPLLYVHLQYCKEPYFRIPGFGNSSTVEWLDPSMRAFSGYFANIADHLGNRDTLPTLLTT